MSTASVRTATGRSEPELGDETIAFVKAFDAWLRKASLVSAGESVPRLRLLYELHCNGPQKMTDLADRLGVTPRNVTAIVDGLESERLVQRSDHPTDRRVTMIELTGGSEAVDRGMAAFRTAVDALFDGVSASDREAFARVVASVADRIGQSVSSDGRNTGGPGPR